MDCCEIIKTLIPALFISNCWSYQGQQLVGILTILLSAIKNDSAKELIKQRLWQKNTFNTNPYCSGVMVGILLNSEKEILNDAFFSLQHIFGSIGDDFFWRSLRPMLLSFAVLILLIGYLLNNTIDAIGIFNLAPLIFFIPFNIIAQGTRIQGIVRGKKYGRVAAVQLIQNLRKPIATFYNILAVIMGLLFTVLIVILGHYNIGFVSPITIYKIVFTLIVILLLLISFLLSKYERSNSYLLIISLLILLIIKVL
ncbi:MAG: PTS system mannose/fructose/sorbose family transporter subunit IID [candidate division WOR-3 bacterium]|nr:PTS system mannose/fructose/sorbose family transporter subunit IID [candidate division WOR-3 bacterium]